MLISCLFLHLCFYVGLGYTNEYQMDDSRLVKRYVPISGAREEVHVRVLKYFSGRYKSIPVAQTTEIVQDVTEDVEVNNTTMEPFIRITTTSAPDEINKKVFGGYFSSLLGTALAYHFNVTSKIFSTPPYAMAHYFFPGDFPAPYDAVVGESSITNCTDVSDFCLSGSKLMCLTNGTVYCITPMESTMSLIVEGFRKRGIQTEVKVPCQGKGLKSCLKLIPVHIPCYLILNIVEGDECAKKKTYKMKYCATIIGYPVRQYKNDEFMDYMHDNNDSKRVANHTVNSFMNAVLNYILR